MGLILGWSSWWCSDKFILILVFSNVQIDVSFHICSHLWYCFHMFIMILVFTYVHNVVNCFPMFIMMLMFTYVHNDVNVCALSYRQPRLRDEVVNCLQNVAGVQVVVVRVAVVRVAHLEVVQHRFQLAGRNLKCFIVITELYKECQNLAVIQSCFQNFIWKK